MRHVTKHECDWKRERRGSVNVEEDQEVCDQCQTVEARSRQGETEEQTQVEDQVEEQTFQHQHGDGSQETGDDANQDAREPHSTRSKRSTETGRSERVEDRENTSAVRL